MQMSCGGGWAGAVMHRRICRTVDTAPNHKARAAGLCWATNAGLHHGWAVGLKAGTFKPLRRSPVEHPQALADPKARVTKEGIGGWEGTPLPAVAPLEHQTARPGREAESRWRQL